MILKAIGLILKVVGYSMIFHHFEQSVGTGFFDSLYYRNRFGTD